MTTDSKPETAMTLRGAGRADVHRSRLVHIIDELNARGKKVVEIEKNVENVVIPTGKILLIGGLAAMAILGIRHLVRRPSQTLGQRVERGLSRLAEPAQVRPSVGNEIVRAVGITLATTVLGWVTQRALGALFDATKPVAS